MSEADNVNEAAAEAGMQAAIAKAMAESVPEDLVDPATEVIVSEHESGDSVLVTTPGSVVHPTNEFQNLELGVDNLAAFAGAINNSTQWDGAAPDPKSGDIVSGTDKKGNTVSLQITQPLNQPATQQSLPGGANWTLPANLGFRPRGVALQCVMGSVDYDYIELDVCVNGVVQTRKFPVLRN